jgi:hypothetical protein
MKQCWLLARPISFLGLVMSQGSDRTAHLERDVDVDSISEELSSQAPKQEAVCFPGEREKEREKAVVLTAVRS